MRSFFPRPSHLGAAALLAAIALASAGAFAEKPLTPNAAPKPASSSAKSGAACPAGQGSRAVTGDAKVAEIRSQLAQRGAAPPTPGASGQMLNASGYNYGGDSGSVSLPGAMTFDAKIQR